ncbi:MAG TPA: SpoIIE family protein phosphatase [Planctomycetaceae bacterium]|nr:SpoIIE family protein phosphatase [Planctomycetaceae bacterium]
MSQHVGPSMLQSIIDNTLACIYVKDLQCRYLHINRQFESVFHVTRQDVIGKSDFDLFPAQLAGSFQRNDRFVLETATRLECEEVAPHDDGLHTYISIKVPLRDDDERIFAVAGISTDITDRLRARHEIEMLQHRTQLLLEAVGEGICGIDLAGRITFLNPAAERLLAWPMNELVGHSLEEILPRPFGCRETEPLGWLIKPGAPMSAEFAEIVSRQGERIPVEYLANPVYEAGILTGAVLALRDQRERLKELRREQELQAASRVQQFLYPRLPPMVKGFDLAGATHPSARVCGDYFDFIPWGDHAWCLALGDVSGHGFGPALQMVETRAFLRAAVQGTDSPGVALHHLNQTLCNDLPEGMFVSLFVARLDTVHQRFQYASAGHPAGLMRSSGTLAPLKSTGMLLGLIENAAYVTSDWYQLYRGDLLVVTSDGIVEMISPQQTLFGSDRLWRCVAEHRHESSAVIRDAMLSAALEFAQGVNPHDDVTILVAKCLTDEGQFRMTFADHSATM